MDLAPGRSLVEFLVGQGQQVFIISWRNPLAHHADWDSDTYAAEIIKAMDITAKAAGVEKVALTGICSGGILSSFAVAHLAATDRLDRLAAFSLFVTVLDQEHAGMPAALAGPRTTDLAKRASRQRGFIDGRDLAEAFAWLRPGDLVGETVPDVTREPPLLTIDGEDLLRERAGGGVVRGDQHQVQQVAEPQAFLAAQEGR